MRKHCSRDGPIELFATIRRSTMRHPARPRTLVDLVHHAEGWLDHILQRHEEHDRAHRPLAPRLHHFVQRHQRTARRARLFKVEQLACSIRAPSC